MKVNYVMPYPSLSIGALISKVSKKLLAQCRSVMDKDGCRIIKAVKVYVNNQAKVVAVVCVIISYTFRWFFIEQHINILYYQPIKVGLYKLRPCF